MFIQRVLGFELDECLFMSEFGGAFPAAQQFRLPSTFRHFEGDLKFAFEKFPSITHSIGITHDRCARYAEALVAYGEQFLGECSTMKALQERDLETYSHTVRGLAPPLLTIYTFHMDLVNEEGTEAVFRQIW